MLAGVEMLRFNESIRVWNRHQPDGVAVCQEFCCLAAAMRAGIGDVLLPVAE